MLKDIRYALRTLVSQRAFTAVIVVTLALGIGANTAIFSVVNAVLLRDLPFPDAEQIYKLDTVPPDGRASDGAMAPLELDRLNEAGRFVEYAAGTFRYEGTVLDPEGNPLKVLAYAVSEGFFEIFGAPMALGRTFNGEDYVQAQTDIPGLIISYSVWRDFFGQNPGIIGTSIRIEGTLAEIVGIAAPGFDFPRGTDVWAPMGNPGPPADAGNFLEGYALAPEGVSAEQFQSSLDTFREDLMREFPDRTLLFRAEPLKDWLVGDLDRTVIILLGATGILLLIACVNVTNLLLSRGTARAREVAVRVAVGAGHARVVRQLMTESLVLASVGGIVGLGVAYAGVRLLLATGPSDLPRMNSIPIDANVLVFALGAVLFTGIFVGLAPAVRLATTDLRTLVNEGGRGNSAGPATHRIFSTLVVSEIALAVLLVTGAGLLVGSYIGLSNTDGGFDPDRRLTFEMALPFLTYQETRGIADFYRELLERIHALPGVVSAGATTTLPLGDELDYMMPYQIFGEAARPPNETPQGRLRAVTVDLFSTQGTRVIAGRDFARTDRLGQPGVAIVNESFVRQFFPDKEPLGQRVQIPPVFAEGSPASALGVVSIDTAEVVGIVPDVRYASLNQEPEAAMYLPFEQATFRRVTVVVRSATDDLAGLIPGIRREIADMEPEIPVEFEPFPQILSASLARERLGMMLFVVFGSVALVMAAVGVYGVISYSVTQRRGEIAVRATLGATRQDILRLIMRHGATLAIAGVVIGVAAAVAMRQVIASQLYGISALDPRVLLSVPLVLFAVSLAATLLPAVRATRIDPSLVLRSE